MLLTTTFHRTVCHASVIIGVALLIGAAGCDDTRSNHAAPVAASPSVSIAGMSQYPYLAADGGPHMLLPASEAHAWRGVPSMFNVLDPKSDYGRACAATAATQMASIPVGSESALVFADPPMTAWGTSSDGLVEVYYLEAWSNMNLDALISRATAATPTAAMTDSGKRIRFAEADAFLLFAGDTTTSTAYGVHRVAIAAGEYRVLVGQYTAPGDSVTLYRLQPIVP